MKNNILIIDDETQVRQMLRGMLEEEDYNVFEAPNGLIKKGFIDENEISLVITDIVMPDKDGLETINDLKAEHPELKIIAASGGGRIDSGTFLESAKLLGADRTFGKPLDFDDLLDAVDDLIGD